MNSKRLAKFLIITFLISWIAWCGLAALTSLNIVPFSHPLGTILHINRRLRTSDSNFICIGRKKYD